MVIYLDSGRAYAHTQPPHVAKAITDAGFVIVKDPRRWPERNGETKTGKLASNRYLSLIHI